jgi:hypothetical protein
MTDSPLRQQIAEALADATGNQWPAQAFLTEADAVLAVINPIGKGLAAQLRHAECRLIATQATLADCLNSFIGYRNSDGLGDIQYWRSPQVLPHEMRRWQNTAGHTTTKEN